MEFFKKSDKSDTFNFFPEDLELNLGDISHEFQSGRDESNQVFGRFDKTEVESMLEESQMWKALSERGFNETRLEINILSNLDNRIYIKNNKGEVLVHIRLKVDDFFLKKIEQTLRMVYIDWLLTQNIKFNFDKKKELFEGQEYPGLNIFKEITSFIMIMSTKLGAHGIFNVPEYFHDAVLFHRRFKFLDPIKEGKFRAVLNSFKGQNLRKISKAIHENRVIKSSTGEVYLWPHGEMFTASGDSINEQVFDQNYFHKMEKYLNEKYSFMNES